MTDAPKYIANHPAVAFYDRGENQASDYRHYVELKDGWKFTWGKMAGCSSLFFNRRDDFELAEPKLRRNQ